MNSPVDPPPRSSSTTPLILACGICLLALVYFLRRRHSPLKHIPGPPPTVPLVNIYIPPVSPENSERWLHDLYRQYGSILRIPCGLGDDLVLLSTKEVFKELLTKYGHLVGERDHAVPEKELFDGPLSIFGDWKLLRKVLMYGFLRKRSLYESTLEFSAGQLCEAISQDLADTPIGALSIISRFMSSCFANMILSQHFELSHPFPTQFTQIIAKSLAVIKKAEVFRAFPHMKYLPLGWRVQKEIDATRKEMAEAILPYLDHFEVPETVDGVKVTSATAPDLLSYLKLKQWEEINAGQAPETFSDMSIALLLSGIVFAGLNLSVTSVLRLLRLLLLHPHWQTRIQEQVDALGPEPITVARQDKCTNAKAFVTEMFRIDMPIGGSMPTKLMGDVVLAGQRLPQGTSVLFNTRSIREDPGLFENPLEFDPYRFVTPEGEFRKNFEALDVFSFGPRSCIGKGMAITIAMHTLVRLLQEFTVENGESFLPPKLMDVRSDNQHKVIFRKRHLSGDALASSSEKEV